MVALLVTLPYSSTAAGVKMLLLPSLLSPETTIAVAMGVITPPSGIEMLPVNSTLYRAMQDVGLLTMPRRTKIPVPLW